MDKRKDNKTGWIVGGVLVGGGALYLAWDKLFKKKNPDATEEAQTTSSDKASIIPSIGKTTRHDRFPLKKGSLGARVFRLQEALQQVLGSEILSQYTPIDGDFGSGTENALRRAGWPVVIDEITFNRLTALGGSEVQPAFNAKALSGKLFSYAAGRNLDGVLSILRQFRDTNDYREVNKYFVDAQVFSVARSIVTYLLDISFPTNAKAKEDIRKEFLRMGLKSTLPPGKDPVKEEGGWSLSGFKKDIITIKGTHVTDRANRKIPVAPNTILGEEVALKNGMTYFRGLDGNIYSVPTIKVKYA